MHKAFIDKIAPLAQKDYLVSGVLPSITIAQAILESNWGRSGLTQNANNLFGIKGSYKGQTTVMRTDEVYGGKRVTVAAGFRKYPSWEESVTDHGKLFQLTRYKHVRGETDYKKAAHAVKNAGYATDPKYPAKLISIIQDYKLYEYDGVEQVEVIRVVVNKDRAVDGILEDNRTYVPAAELKKFGINVDWDNENKVLHIWK